MLGREIVYGQSTVYLCLSKYIGFENTHTHIATVASGTEGGTAVSCMESHMNRRPLGSIHPNSIRETELHTECRRRQERESLYSIFVPVKDSAIAASCDEPLAASRVGRTPRGGSTQSATPRGLDCGYRVPSGKVGLVSVHLCESGHRASPTSPRLKRDMTFGVGSV